MSLMGLPIVTDERTGLSMVEIAARVRKTRQEFADKGQRLGLVIVDHVGKIKPRDHRAPMVDQIGQVSNDLATLAKSEDVAMLALHQLNRGVESREDKRPFMSDLRASGNLEQDADGVWLLFRPAYYLRKPEDSEAAKDSAKELQRLRDYEAKKHIIEIIADKTRNGRIGTVEAFCDIGFNIITDLDRRHAVKVDFVAGALPYAEQLGWKVLLLAPGSKLPFFSKEKGGNGVHDATSDPDQIRAWGKLCPDGNIGIACGEASGIVVVDVDPRNGGDVSIRALAAKGHPFPKAPRQRTGNGGYHLVYRHQAGIGNSKGRLGPGIDVKSTGGYIVAAPSWIRPSKDGPGGPYVWEVSPFDVPPPRMPIWMATILCPPPRPTPAFAPDVNGGDIEPLARFVAASTKGERNNRLHWAACRAGEMAARGQVSAQSAGSRLVAAAAAAGYIGAEVVRTIDSGFRQSGQTFR